MADYGGTRAHLPEPSAPAAARPRQAGPLLTALFGVALLGLVVIAYFDPLPTAAPTDYKVSGGGADVSPEQLAQLTKKYDFVKSRHLVVPCETPHTPRVALVESSAAAQRATVCRRRRYGPHPSQVLNFWEALPPLVKGSLQPPTHTPACAPARTILPKAFTNGCSGTSDKKTGKLFDPTEAGKPRPLIVNIHGGTSTQPTRFCRSVATPAATKAGAAIGIKRRCPHINRTGGDCPGGWQQQDYRQNQPQSTALSLGISFAAIEYRRVCGPASAAAPQIGGVNRAKDCANLPAPVFDAKRAIQFLKSKAKEWNIDPDRIILKGNAAPTASDAASIVYVCRKPAVECLSNSEHAPCSTLTEAACLSRQLRRRVLVNVPELPQRHGAP